MRESSGRIFIVSKFFSVRGRVHKAHRGTADFRQCTVRHPCIPFEVSFFGSNQNKISERRCLRHTPLRYTKRICLLVCNVHVEKSLTQMADLEKALAHSFDIGMNVANPITQQRVFETSGISQISTQIFNYCFYASASSVLKNQNGQIKHRLINISHTDALVRFDTMAWGVSGSIP